MNEEGYYVGAWVKNPICICGHAHKHHSRRGRGMCEHSDCQCREFKYPISLPVVAASVSCVPRVDSVSVGLVTRNGIPKFKQTPWACPSCGGRGWHGDVVRGSTTRFCSDCDWQGGPSDKGYPLTKDEEAWVRITTLEKELKHIAFLHCGVPMDEPSFDYTHVGAYVEGQMDKLEDALDKAREAQLVPGLWECSKCGFTAHNSTLYVGSGNIGVSKDDATQPELCPNDGLLLQRVSWKELAEKYLEMLKGRSEVPAKPRAEDKRSAPEDNKN